MLRIVRLSLYLAALVALWAALLAADLDKFHHQLVLFAPVLAVLAFGVYAAVALLYGVATFRTVPEEANSLAKEVEIAKADLAQRGIQLTRS